MSSVSACVYEVWSQHGSAKQVLSMETVMCSRQCSFSLIRRFGYSFILFQIVFVLVFSFNYSGCIFSSFCSVHCKHSSYHFILPPAEFYSDLLSHLTYAMLVIEKPNKMDLPVS